jgi:hypothetical protein
MHRVLDLWAFCDWLQAPRWPSASGDGNNRHNPRCCFQRPQLHRCCNTMRYLDLYQPTPSRSGHMATTGERSAVGERAYSPSPRPDRYAFWYVPTRLPIRTINFNCRTLQTYLPQQHARIHSNKRQPEPRFPSSGTADFC